MPTVFIVRDHTMAPILDRLEADLRTHGIDVIRGPWNTPGSVVPLPMEYVKSELSRCHVAVFSSRWICDRDTLTSLPRLVAVVNPTIGVETVDIAAATELGIVVGHGGAKDHVTSMAEAAIMLMLNLSFQLRKTEDVMSGRLARPLVTQSHSRMLHGSTVGLIGLGRIGRAVMERLSAFGVRMLAYSPRVDTSTLPADVTMVDLESLMRESDIVGVFIAVRPDNRKMINAESLAFMKPSAYLVNISRGDAIDEPALIEVLQKGLIAGAALDTFEVEPLPEDSPLRGMPNVILTPHLVGHTVQAIESISLLVLENILRVVNGALPVYCKNPGAALRLRERASNRELA